MASIVAGIGSSHVPSIAVAYDKNRQEEAAWKPLFDAYRPVKQWLEEEVKPDVVVVIYNDHGTDFFLDKYPTFALGVAEEYEVADEGYGKRPLPRIKGHARLSAHIAESVVAEDFDLTVCQEIALDHGALTPLPLLWSHEDDWRIQVIPLEVNVIQHPLPSAARCFTLGQAIRRAILSYPEECRVAILGTGGLSHQLTGERAGFINEQWDQRWLDHMEGDPTPLTRLTHRELVEHAGAEGIELIMWLIMRGAMSANVRRLHRNYYAPMTTGMGLITLQDRA